MTLQAPNLDDLRFQSDLVDEARKRIIHYCPEWTEYNLSDPGITMIELFAWMTEMMVYRLNRVPERNYIKFLDMLGFSLEPAKTAEANITFWLSALLPLSPDDDTKVIVPAATEIQSADQPEPVIFTTKKKLTISAPILTQLRTEDQFNSNRYPRLNVETFYPFNRQLPREGDTFYIGFDEKNDLSGHILQFNFSCEPTEAVGIRREDPPWVWECLTSEGWTRVNPSTFEGEKDTTGGLNNENGHLTLYMPLTFSAQQLHGLNCFWVRCRIEQRDASQGMYTESPRVVGLEVYTVGAQTPAVNAQVIENEYIGESSGEPGQQFTLANSPVLYFEGEERLEIEEQVGTRTVFMPWTAVRNFSKSTKFDRHYVLNTADGTITFGPSVRQPDGSVIQYGRIPESGHRIRVSRYRYGGGVAGNLPENAINMMNTSLAYISRASNLKRATGGRDRETLQELIYRTQRELQAQQRAVTAADFELFALNSSRNIARACCVTPQQSGSNVVNLILVPSVSKSLAAHKLNALAISEDTRAQVRKYLDKYRLMTTALNIDEPKYYGIKVKVKVAPQDFAHEEEVERDIQEALQKYLTPLQADEEHPAWPFGKSVFKAEIIAMIQQLPTVKYVLDTEVLWRRVTPANEDPDEMLQMESELKPINERLLLPPDGLVCSLDHVVESTTLEDYAKDSEQS